jgi:hypothetical protein
MTLVGKKRREIKEYSQPDNEKWELEFVVGLNDAWEWLGFFGEAEECLGEVEWAKVGGILGRNLGKVGGSLGLFSLVWTGMASLLLVFN